MENFHTQHLISPLGIVFKMVVPASRHQLMKTVQSAPAVGGLGAKVKVHVGVIALCVTADLKMCLLKCA